MKAKYLPKLNDMIKDVDKIKSEEPKGSAESQKQYDEIQKKLTLLKTLITADFKPNSNFPPRKEILEAAEKQIAMWIKEWDKLMRFANSSQTQSGHEVPGHVKTEGGPSYPQETLASGNSLQQDFQHRVGNPTPPPPMATNFGYNQDGFDQDISALLDLDNLSNFPDFSMMQGSVAQPNMPQQSNGQMSSSNGSQMQGRNYQNGANGDGYQDYSGDTSNYNDNFSNDYPSGDQSNFQDSDFSNDPNQNYQNDPNQNYQNDPNQNYQNGPNQNFQQDNFSGNNYSNGGNGNQNQPDDKSTIDTFDDLDCGTEYLTNSSSNVLGKRKSNEPDFFDQEQPSKYSKTEPL